mmetsp:Transcript_98313/g.278578  ORF Transcript_98313/g.278578 Transcript_98313/m.278578 type:complete len:354 (-) Transcript_98313:126-1187(-)
MLFDAPPLLGGVDASLLPFDDDLNDLNLVSPSAASPTPAAERNPSKRVSLSYELSYAKKLIDGGKNERDNALERPWWMKLDGVTMASSADEATENFLNDDEMISLERICKRGHYYNRHQQEAIRDELGDAAIDSLMYWQGEIDEFLKCRRQAYDAHVRSTARGARSSAAPGGEPRDAGETSSESEGTDEDDDDDPFGQSHRMSLVTDASSSPSSPAVPHPGLRASNMSAPADRRYAASDHRREPSQPSSLHSTGELRKSAGPARREPARGSVVIAEDSAAGHAGRKSEKAAQLGKLINQRRFSTWAPTRGRQIRVSQALGRAGASAMAVPRAANSSEAWSEGQLSSRAPSKVT